MNPALWTLQIVLAVVFVAAGAAKLVLPSEQLQPRLGGWVDAVSTPWVRLLGVIEVAAGIGLVAPAAIGIASVLTPLAALGAAIVLLGAVLIHVRHGELSKVVFTVVLTVAAAVVAWGRFGPYSF